jgi:hypothetical protein
MNEHLKKKLQRKWTPWGLAVRGPDEAWPQFPFTGVMKMDGRLQCAEPGESSISNSLRSRLLPIAGHMLSAPSWPPGLNTRKGGIIGLFVRRRGRVKDLPSSVSRTCWIGQQDCIEQTRLQYGNVGRTYINELL